MSRLGINDNGDFYDTEEDTLGGGTTGRMFGSNQGVPDRAGEQEATDYWSMLKDMLPEGAAKLVDAVSLGENPRADSVSLSSERTRGNQVLEEAPKEDNVLSRILAGVTKAYDKDPMSFIKLGLGTVGGMYLADEKRKAAAAQAQSQIDQQNNADALYQAKIKRINDARRNPGGKLSAGQPTLKRTNGTPVFTNGVIKG